MEVELTRAYSDDLRGRVLAAVASGSSARGAGRRFGVAPSTAVRWMDRQRLHNETSARRQGKPRGSRLDGHEAFILGLIDEQKDITLTEMVERLEAERDVRISRAMLCIWLRRRGFTHKKRQRMPLNRNALTS